MKKLFVFLLLLAAIAAQTALEAYSQVKEGEESEIIFRKTWNEFGIQGNILNAIFTPDESKILLSAEDKFLELDANTGSIIREIPGIYGAKQFSSDGEFFYTYDRRKIRYATMEVIGRYEEGFPDTWTIKDFVVDEKYGLYIMVVQHAKSTIPNDPRLLQSIFIYDLNTFQLKKVTGIADHYVSGINISPTEKYFMINSTYDPDVVKEGDGQAMLSIWDKLTLTKIEDRNEFLGNKAFSPDGKWLAVAQNELIKFYDAKTLEKKWEKTQQYPDIPRTNALAFSKDSKYLAIGGLPNEKIINIHIWNVETGDIEKKYTDIGETPQQNIEFNSNYRILGSHQSVIGLFGSKFNSIVEAGDKKIGINSDGSKIFLKLFDTDPLPINIELYNSTGARISVLYKGINQIDYIFDISDLAKGIYFVNVKINNEVFSEKFIKE